MRHLSLRRTGGRRGKAMASALLLAIASIMPAALPAAASTTITVQLAERGPYTCLGPCASATYFSAKGVARGGSLGAFTYAGQGVVLDYDPATNCLDQAETWAYTAQNGHDGKDTLWLATTADTLCFTADPNVSYENATFVITGGTGRFAGATGTGSISITVITHPQVGSGTVTATITL